jgi:oligopeptidase B
VDDYAWMRDHDAPAMREYLAAERAYYDARTRHLDRLAAELYREAVARTPDAADDSVGWTLRGYRYWYRTPSGANNRQLLRARVDEPARAPDVLLDENRLGEATGYIEIGVAEVSQDDRLLAWSADTSGAEVYGLRFTEIDTGRDLPDIIERTYPGGAWSADSTRFFYLAPDQLNRPHQLWRHVIGTEAEADVLVYEETDARYELTLELSRSGELVIITAASRDTTEVRLIPAARPDGAPVLVEPRRRGIEYRVDHAADPGGGDGELLIVTDDGHSEFTLMRAPVAAPGRASWTPAGCPAVAPAVSGVRLERCDVLAGHLVLSLRRDGARLLAITGHDAREVAEIHPAPAAGSIRLGDHLDYHADAVTICEESLVEPRRWSELDLRTGKRRELKRAVVPDYEPARYRTRRLLARAADGTAIPVTIACRADARLDGTEPCLLYGYGAYESSLDPEFESSLPSVLDRGVVYAIAHVRGGGECGRHWWQQGRLRAKPNTFSDFVDVAGWLAGDGGGIALVDGSRIVSRGLSAGGLLQAAAYSRAPERWRAVVAEVPFVDVVTTMLDPGIPLTIQEWDEWGDPRDPDDFACMRGYSPYENPPAGPRPALLVTGAVHDPRVLVHEPAKWVARLRATDTAGSTILFRVELGAGAHTGPSGRYGHLRYEAEVYAFILDAVGMTS